MGGALESYFYGVMGARSLGRNLHGVVMSFPWCLAFRKNGLMAWICGSWIPVPAVAWFGSLFSLQVSEWSLAHLVKKRSSTMATHGGNHVMNRLWTSLGQMIHSIWWRLVRALLWERAYRESGREILCQSSLACREVSKSELRILWMRMWNG